MTTEHIFIIDDDKFFAKYFIMKFKLLVNKNVEFHHFAGLRPAFTANTEIAPCIIFLDNLMNEESGVDALPELCELYPNAEIILISASIDKELSAKAAKNGASRFISKDDILMENIYKQLSREWTHSKQEKLIKRVFKRA